MKYDIDEAKNPHPMGSTRVVNKKGHELHGKKVKVNRTATGLAKKGIHGVSLADDSSLVSHRMQSSELQKESVEQVDELSIKTLSKYNDKASKDPKRAKGSNMSVRKIVKKTMRGEGRNSDLKSPELSEEKDYFIKGLDLGDVKAKFVRRGKSMSSPIFIKVTASDTGKSHEMGPYRKIDIARKELSKMHESTIIEGIDFKTPPTKLLPIIASKTKDKVAQVGVAKGKNSKGVIMTDDSYGHQMVYQIGTKFLVAVKVVMTAGWSYFLFDSAASVAKGPDAAIAKGGAGTGVKNLDKIAKGLKVTMESVEQVDEAFPSHAAKSRADMRKIVNAAKRDAQKANQKALDVAKAGLKLAIKDMDDGDRAIFSKEVLRLQKTAAVHAKLVANIKEDVEQVDEATINPTDGKSTGRYSSVKQVKSKADFMKGRKDTRKKPRLSHKEEVEQVNEGEFNDKQIDALRVSYASLKTINPTGPAWKKVTKMLDSKDKETLEQIAFAKIKFLSQAAARTLESRWKVKLRPSQYMGESIYQMDELSGDKLHSYISKAMNASDTNKRRSDRALKITGTAKTASTVRRAQKVANHQANKRTKRELGIQQALWKQTGKAKVNAREELSPVAIKQASKHLDKGSRFSIPSSDGKSVFTISKKLELKRQNDDAYMMDIYAKDGKKLIKNLGSHPSFAGALKYAATKGYTDRPSIHESHGDEV